MVETILVTGASGYLASHVIQSLLNAGYNVRGTVGSVSNTQSVQDRYLSLKDKLSFVAVPDIAAPMLSMRPLKAYQESSIPPAHLAWT